MEGALNNDNAANLNPVTRKKAELKAFLFLTVAIAPILSVMIVGAFGFAIWLSQMVLGPPGMP